MGDENNNNGFFGTIGQALKSGFGASVGGLPGALAGTAIGSLLSSSQAKKQHDLNMRDWYAMQDYNSPKNQVSRLKDAGLNPARALAGGQIENVTGMPNPTDVNAGLPEGLSSHQVNQEMSMKYLANQAEVDSIKQQANVAKEQAEGLKLDNELKRAKLPNELLGEQALQDLYINVDADGTVTYGDLNADGEFVPRYDSDSNLLPGLHNALYAQKGKELIGRGYLVDYQAYENNRSKLQNALTERFGAQNARAVIRNLDAAAYLSRQSGKAMQLDNDVFENISIGGKSAGLAVDGLKVLLSVLRGK